MKPLFLFSLPRSGSTLLQRELAAFPQIGTTAEPWMLLPAFFALRKQGVYGIYGHRSLAAAHEDMIARMDRGITDYYEILGVFMREFHARVAHGDHIYFLDKTPRYHLIANEIMKAVPDGKFIFLWRNPLAIAASIVSTWGGGKWNLHRHWVDLYAGMQCLLDAFETAPGAKLGIRYERLLSEPDATIRAVLEFLELPVPDKMPPPVKRLEGRMGDPTGVKEFDGISREPLERWKTVFRNPLRRAWARSYLQWLGDDAIRRMGYDPDQLRGELDQIEGLLPFLADDLVRMPVGEVSNYLELRILKDKLRSLLRHERTYCLR